MARRQQVIHINSNVKGKLPTGSTESVVDYGEIAVNYNETDPFLSILKNGKTGTSNADFAKFSADEVLEKLFDEKYATIEEIEKNEETISGALNELNEKVESIEDLVLDFTLLPQKNPVVGSDGNQTASYTADEVQLGITNGMTYAEFFQAILSGKVVIIKNTIEDGIIEHLRPFKCGHIKNVNGYNAVVFVYSYIYDLDDHRDTEFIIMMSYDETGMVWADSARLLATHESVRPLKIGDKEYNVFNEVTITAADLGLGNVLKYCGITTTELVDGSTATTVVIDGKNHTAEPGCVVFRDITENGNTVTQEFVYNGSKWELLGKDLTYKVIQTQIDSPTTSGNEIAFIDTISQNANGVITATRKNVRSATTSQTGVVQLNNTVTSNSTSQAATAKAVKTAFDKGAEALTAANGKWTAVDATTSVKGIVTLKEGDLSGVTATTSGVAASSYHTHSQYATKQEVDDNEEVTSNALNVLNASISELEQTIEDNNALVLDLSLIGGIKSNLTSSELEIGFGGKRTYEEIFQEIANGKQVVLKYNNGFGTQILYPNTWFDGNGYVFIYNDIPSFTSFEVNNRVMVLTFTSDGCSTVNNELWVSRTGHTHDNYLTKTDGTVVKTTPQTLSDTDKNQVKENLGISTPDWNAQKGEDGYIENKPITKKFIKEQSMEFNEVDEWNSVYAGYDAVPSNTMVARVFADITRYGGEHITTTVIVQNGSVVDILENDEENYLHISMFNTSEGLTMNVGASFEFSGTLKCYYYEEFKQLDEDYIPDTVLKTTPQTLSDAAKNQVKENLGISISTPDWNAQKGEAGYIENKPFYTDINIPIVQYNGGAIDNDRLEINVGLFDRFVIRTPYDFIEIENGAEYDFMDNPLPTPIPNVEIVYIQYKNEWIYIESSDIDYNLPLINWINTECYGGPYTSDIVKMPQYFIPDTVIKTTPQTLSDDDKNQVKENLGISTPDWNAQEGESGYIENRTHYTEKVNGELFQVTEDIYDIHYKINLSDNELIDDVFYLRVFYAIDDTNILLNKVYKSSNFHNELNHGLELGTIETPLGYLYIFVNIDTDNIYTIVVASADGGYFNKEGVINEFIVEKIYALDEQYLPDTALKTTPQALSDDEKNQVKENLGISISTPDWNAQKGEAGYIENKTHGLLDITLLENNGDTAYGMLDTQYIKIQDEIYPISRGETVVLKNGPYISVTYEDNELVLNDPDDMVKSFGGVFIAIGLQEISEYYIPNTIARKEYVDEIFSNLPTVEMVTQVASDLEDYKNELEISGTVHNAERIGGLTINEIVEQLGTGNGGGSGSGGNFSPTYKDTTSSVPLIAYELNKAVYSDVMMTKNQVWAPGGFFQKSDERLKNFVEDIEVDLDKIALLPKKYFYWKDDVNGGKQIGTSAQAVKELYPEMVSEGEDGLLNVDYDKLIVVALKAIDILNEERKQMKSDIQQIKDKLGL